MGKRQYSARATSEKEMAKDENGLTDNQIVFCNLFMSTMNATQAYQSAYQCSVKAAESGSSRLLRNAKVQAYLQSMRQRVGDRTQITLERTMEEIAKLAFSDITTALTFDQSGVKLKPSSELPPSVTAAIEAVSSKESIKGQISYTLKMHSKPAALALLADFFGIRDDFNKARATLKRYGLLLLVDEDSPIGWRLERVSPDSTDPTP